MTLRGCGHGACGYVVGFTDPYPARDVPDLQKYNSGEGDGISCSVRMHPYSANLCAKGQMVTKFSHSDRIGWPAIPQPIRCSTTQS